MRSVWRCINSHSDPKQNGSLDQKASCQINGEFSHKAAIQNQPDNQLCQAIKKNELITGFLIN